MKIKTLVQEDNSIIFQSKTFCLDIYIPKKNFDRSLSEYNGAYIKTLGIFAFDIKQISSAEKGKFGIFHTLKFPNIIQFTYSDHFKYEGTLNNGLISSREYEVFRLTDGDIFMDRVVIEQSATAVINFVNSLHDGQIPETIPYPELINLYLNALDLNHVSLKNPSVVFELILSELCRDKNDLHRPFREAIARQANYNQFAYQSINLREIPSLSNTFAALSFYALSKSYSFFTGANHLESHIPPGTPGNILSSGLILPLNICVGLVVACTMYGFYALFRKGDL